MSKVNQASEDFASDLAALRDDIARLTGSVSDLLRHRANDASNQAYNIFGQARDKATKHASRARDDFANRASDARDDLSNRASDLRDRLADHASDAQDRFGSISSDIETRIERNPLTAVVVAAIAGLLMGLLSRSL